MTDEKKCYNSEVSMYREKRDVTGMVIESQSITLKGQEKTKELLNLAKKEMRD
jgi:hypothetical protein